MNRLTRRSGLGALLGASLPALGLSTVANAKKNRKKKKVTLCANGQTVKKPKKQAKKLLNQGATKGACDTTLCGNGGPCTVFVTAAKFTISEIGGLAGGDARCQAAAAAANLNGTQGLAFLRQRYSGNAVLQCHQGGAIPPRARWR